MEAVSLPWTATSRLNSAEAKAFQGDVVSGADAERGVGLSAAVGAVGTDPEWWGVGPTPLLDTWVSAIS